MATKQKKSAANREPAPTTGEDLVAQLVHQWNRLVSNTNWEKGRIICDWREALLIQGAGVTEYSDEAWAQLVGGVTAQHVGRLRRTFQRFGEDRDQYPGLFWSHFLAALEWDDAPMWLEGAIQNDWSVSEMRGKRWEVLGTPEAQQQAELAEANPWEESPSENKSASDQVYDFREPNTNDSSVKPSARSRYEDTVERHVQEESPTAQETTPAKQQPKRAALNVNVELLPDDLADAFEQFKLAIIAHRREGWRDTTRETVCECLDALKSLALADD
jgi:hypothetical protein